MGKLIIALLILVVATPVPAGWIEGIKAFRKGEYEIAADEFRKAMEQEPAEDPEANPQPFRAHYMLGMSLARLQLTDEAIAELKRGYAMNNGDPGAKAAMARARLLGGDARRTAILLDGVDPSDLSTADRGLFFETRGRLRLDKGRYPEAVTDLEKASRFLPHHWQILRYLGQGYRMTDRLIASHTALEKALARVPEGGDPRDVWRELARTFESQRKLADAADAFDKAGEPEMATRLRGVPEEESVAVGEAPALSP